MRLTEVGIVGIAELSSSTKAEVKRQLVGPPEFAAIVDGCESIVHVVEGDEGVVVTVGTKGAEIIISYLVLLLVS